MKKLLIVLIVGSFTILCAQGSIINTLGTNDATSGLIVTNPDGSPLFTVQGDGWIGFGVENLMYPFHAESDHYVDWLDPVGYFNHTVENDGVGVFGRCDNADWYGLGGHFQGGWTGAMGEVYPQGTNNESDYNGIYGYVSGGEGLNRGVHGWGGNGYRAYGGHFEGQNASDRSYGARGEASGSPRNYGLYGKGSVAASGGNTIGVFGDAQGENNVNYGLYGYADGATTNWAVYASGNLHCTGTLSKGAGSFKIDHPLDPENKYLLHSFVESPDMMNIYNGNIELNYSGEALVTLPDWFEPLNSEYRYQLTPIGVPGPNLYIAQEVNGNTFRIAGGKAGMKVSWQITGIRKDAYAVTNRIEVEERKTGEDIGRYLHPKAFGLPESRQINYELIPKEAKSLSKEIHRNNK